MLKLTNDLQNLIITYLDPVTYSILTLLHKDFTLIKYENLYTNTLTKIINTRLSDIESLNIKEISDIVKSCLFEVTNLFRKLEIFNYTGSYDCIVPDGNTSKNLIVINVEILKYFHIYELNDVVVTKSKYGIFYINGVDNFLSFKYIEDKKSININANSDFNKITLITPLWNLLQETMKLAVLHYKPYYN